VVGLEDIVVVDTEDALLVMPRSRSQDVRAVVNALKAQKRNEQL
jgi:mannose-1-phosphate guanylyltransferase